MRILVAEDHPGLGMDIQRGLERFHYVTDLAVDGEDALALALVNPYDLLILDVMLPSLDGFEVCRRVRNAHRMYPILFLTARGEIDDRVRGLDLGGDDYLVKPFAFRELEARVRALLRREHTVSSAILTFNDLVLDTQTHEVRRGSRLLTLSHREYALLEFFLHHPRQVLSRTMIADHVWDGEAPYQSNIIDVYVRYLRNKLCASGEPDVIATIRGVGYQLKEETP
ncbi:response regulator transcription factor [Ktedonospora formicarum]|uniref:response regulator transcription factor n=1 Tax=Ktedonospora formicarum TaxID=2778364 RepID=UPI001C68D526|nr:response regulator transcription factor [Ktedonospora formicarum]